VIYRSLGRLADAGLVVPTGTEAGKGPQRTVYAVSDHGRKTVAAWLDAPVWHIRDVRSQLLIKLALRARIGADPSGLLRRQRDILEPIVEALDEELGAAGEEPGTAGEEPKARDAGQASSDEAPAPPDDFEATLQAWRRAMARAALYFVNEIGRPRA
jgi:PadR family transcriptional regulator AphA